MTLSELRFVVSVAQEKNFRRAAAKSFVSQPALSLAIKKIENELGVLIFERNRMGISLTTVGEKIVNQAQICLLYTSPSPRDRQKSRMPSSA